MKEPDILRAISPVVKAFNIIGIIKVQGDSLDKGYLLRWADFLEVSPLLKDAFSEANIPI